MHVCHILSIIYLNITLKTRDSLAMMQHILDMAQKSSQPYVLLQMNLSQSQSLLLTDTTIVLFLLLSLYSCVISKLNHAGNINSSTRTSFLTVLYKRKH